MATFKQPCIHCGTFIDRDARLCGTCGSRSPFGYQCPSCLRAIRKDQALCEGCGRPLRVACPACGHPTFADSRCEKCGAGLLIACTNPKCGELQFFDAVNCSVCGKKIKKK